MIKRWYLQKLRMAKGMSLQVAADSAGVGKTTLWNMENLPATNTSVRALLRVAQFYGVSVTELLISESQLTQNL